MNNTSFVKKKEQKGEKNTYTLVITQIMILNNLMGRGFTGHVTHY